MIIPGSGATILLLEPENPLDLGLSCTHNWTRRVSSLIPGSGSDPSPLFSYLYLERIFSHTWIWSDSSLITGSGVILLSYLDLARFFSRILLARFFFHIFILYLKQLFSFTWIWSDAALLNGSGATLFSCTWIWSDSSPP
jgi:hypothetical protein